MCCGSSYHCWDHKGYYPKAWREVVSIFTDKWTIYVHEPLSQPSAPRAASAPGNAGAQVDYPYLVDEDILMCSQYEEQEKAQAVSDWYENRASTREDKADAARAAAGETEFKTGLSLRAQWLPAQRADPSLYKMFSAKTLDSGYRKAEDGLLERRVALPAPLGAKFVPIVPEGQATANLTWKRWMFLQCHTGILGAHRNAIKTRAILERQAWWPTMGEDINKWVDKCLTCLRFRRMAQKCPSPDVVPVAYECWEWVMVDLEGPSTLADKEGCIYTMTYLC